MTMGTFQMAVLLTFNGAEKQTFQDLLDSTKLSDKELVKQAQSLIDAKLIQIEVSFGWRIFEKSTHHR